MHRNMDDSLKGHLLAGHFATPLGSVQLEEHLPGLA